MKTGTYIMRLFHFSEQRSVHKVRVEIIGESEKSYHVRLLERGPTGQNVGTTYRPRKHNVIIDPTVEVRTPAELRLPYKD